MTKTEEQDIYDLGCLEGVTFSESSSMYEPCNVTAVRLPSASGRQGTIFVSTLLRVSLLRVWIFRDPGVPTRDPY